MASWTLNLAKRVAAIGARARRLKKLSTLKKLRPDFKNVGIDIGKLSNLVKKNEFDLFGKYLPTSKIKTALLHKQYHFKKMNKLFFENLNVVSGNIKTISKMEPIKARLVILKNVYQITLTNIPANLRFVYKYKKVFDAARFQIQSLAAAINNLTKQQNKIMNKKQIKNIEKIKNTTTRHRAKAEMLETVLVLDSTNLSSWIKQVKYSPLSKNNGIFQFFVTKWYSGFPMQKTVFIDYIMTSQNTPGNGIGTFLWKTYFYGARSAEFSLEQPEASLVEQVNYQKQKAYLTAEADKVVPHSLVQSRKSRPFITPILTSQGEKSPKGVNLISRVIGSNNLRAGVFNI